MRRFLILLGVIAVVSIALAFETSTVDMVSHSRVLGMPVVSFVGDLEHPSWLCVGGGSGVLVVGLFGVGVVSITLYGAGLLFATGQLAAGLMTFAQLGVGAVFFCGQVGAGFVGLGQMVFGGAVGGQLPVGFDGVSLLRQLSDDLNDLLTFR